MRAIGAVPRNYHAEPREDGSYTIEQTPLPRISTGQVNTIYPENHMAWFGSVEGLICYDKRVKKNYRHPYRAFIREVKLVKSKNLVFYGYEIKAGEKPLFPVIDYRDRNLLFDLKSSSLVPNLVGFFGIRRARLSRRVPGGQMAILGPYIRPFLPG